MVPDISVLHCYMCGLLDLWEEINLAKVPSFIVSSSFFTSHPSHNELSSIVPELCMLSHLQFLKLDHNKLMELPCDICLLTSLEELDVSHNNLSALPPKLGNELHNTSSPSAGLVSIFSLLFTHVCVYHIIILAAAAIQGGIYLLSASNYVCGYCSRWQLFEGGVYLKKCLPSCADIVISTNMGI